MLQNFFLNLYFIDFAGGTSILEIWHLDRKLLMLFIVDPLIIHANLITKFMERNQE